MLDNKIKSLKVGIIGEPNTGKSTLLNSIMDEKYSIVTHKANTTLKKINAALTRDNKQIIFTDTPGIITYKKNINRGIFKEAKNVALEADVVILLFNIKKDNTEKIKYVTEYFKNYNT